MTAPPRRHTTAAMPGASRLPAARAALAGVCALTVLGACAAPTANRGAPPERVVRVPDFPPMQVFDARPATAPDQSNAQIARDFVDLTMELESGDALPVFTRFEEPVRVALTGPATDVFTSELQKLLARLRAEARIDIARTDSAASADITVAAVRRDDLERTVPQAACFVVPIATSWDAFRANPRHRDLDWRRLTGRRAATVFVPADISPQEVRDCLHEEIAQALAPVNDLYRLDNSIFNDDNMNSVLTGFDMLILRAAYDPALRVGMTRDQVTNVLPGILSRLNPTGDRVDDTPVPPSPNQWRAAMNAALSPGQPERIRRRAAADALRIATNEGWTDSRLGLSLLTSGRLAARGDSGLAVEALLGARDVYEANPRTAIHAANVGIQLSAFALAAGEMDTVLRLTDRYIPAARDGENAALLADLMLVRAAALDASGRRAEADGVRREAFGWARYGAASVPEVLRRAAEIAALVPPGREAS